MGVAGIQIRPGIEDADDRFSGKILRGIAHLFRPRAMAKGAQIIRSKPTVRAQAFGRAAGTGESVWHKGIYPLLKVGASKQQGQRKHLPPAKRRKFLS